MQSFDLINQSPELSFYENTNLQLVFNNIAPINGLEINLQTLKNDLSSASLKLSIQYANRG